MKKRMSQTPEPRSNAALSTIKKRKEERRGNNFRVDHRRPQEQQSSVSATRQWNSMWIYSVIAL
jgi:hypothetical protein